MREHDSLFLRQPYARICLTGQGEGWHHTPEHLCCFSDEWACCYFRENFQGTKYETKAYEQKRRLAQALLAPYAVC